MSKEKLVFVVVAEQGYIRNINEKNNFAAQNDILFNAISETYIPLLNMFCRLEKENIKFKIGLVLSAPLCTLLDDKEVQKQYVDWLDRRIALGNAELKRCKKNEDLLIQVQACLEKAQQDKIDFIEVYRQNLLSKFKYFAEKEMLELIPTAATYAFLPHYSDLPEILNAQIEAGLVEHRNFFGETGEGFYLPYAGWFDGADKVLRAYGVNYTVLDARSVMFSQNVPPQGIFAPVRTNNSLVVFGSDADTAEEIYGEEGYIHNPVYRSQQRDTGYDLSEKELTEFCGKGSVRVQTGFKYYANSSDIDDNVIYNSEAAEKQAKEDAKLFFEEKYQKLVQAGSVITKISGEEKASLVCVLPAEILGQTWHEGITWFEELLRLEYEKDNELPELCMNLIGNQFNLQKIVPYPSASNGSGYGEDLLDGSNGWMMRYLRKASERMIDLTERFPSDTGLKARLLNLGAKEVLLAQSGDWLKMIHEKTLPDYVKETFINNINSFTSVFDSLGSNTVSTEWLTEMERKHPIFPWINYKIFSKKK